VAASGAALAPVSGAASVSASASAPDEALAAAVVASQAARADRTIVTKAEAARRRKAMAVATVTEGASTSAVLSEGIVQLAVSPWGQIEVDGRPMGTSPPLTRLTLSTGNHTIVVRNADFPAYSATLAVDGESPVTLRHRFGP
jgi:serine/threonine-protein kinase